MLSVYVGINQLKSRPTRVLGRDWAVVIGGYRDFVIAAIGRSADFSKRPGFENASAASQSAELLCHTSYFRLIGGIGQVANSAAARFAVILGWSSKLHP
jgi:hypothetical protein